MVAARRVCSLCIQPVAIAVQGTDGQVFCCHACLEVSRLLAEPLPEKAVSIANEQLTTNINGLWCSSCAWLVEERLRRMPGIAQARVSFLEQKARITYDGSRIEPAAIRRKIRSLGYRAGPDVEPEDGEAFSTRLLVGGLLAMHIMTTSLIIYVRDWMGLSSPDSAWLEHIFYLMQFVVSLPLAAILGLPILRAGLNGLLHGLPNVQTLVSIGGLAALGLSVRNLFAGTGHVYFDTAAMLFFLLTVGRWLEMQAHDSGRTSFVSLLAALPDQILLITADGEKIVPLSEIRPGMRIRLAPGERIPVDGRIAAGTGEVDERMLTGEPAPVLRRAGEDVFAGTINIDGRLDVIVVHIDASTRAGRIQSLLEEWVWQRSPAEKLADRVAARMVFAAIGVAALTFSGYFLAAGLETALLNSLSVLLIACPCALGIATPLTLRQAFNRAAANGVLLRRAGLLEKLPEVKTIYFDKTGTLTEPRHHVRDLLCDGAEGAEIQRLAAALEGHTRHPIGAAIREYTGPAGGVHAEDVRAVPGRGVTGTAAGRRVAIGSRAFIDEKNLSVSKQLAEQVNRAEEAGDMTVYMGWAGRVRGVFVIAERLRPEAKAVLDDLQTLGLAPGVLTGDSKAAGARWEKRLGVPVYAALSPEDKLAILGAAEGAVMVGDGINDGPALAAAAVGIALQGGTDLAQSAAEITLVDDDLAAIPWLYRLGMATRRRLRQNLAWSIAYNLIGVGLAAAGLLQPVLAALAMVLSSLLVTRNALRLRKFDGWKHRPELSADGTETPASLYDVPRQSKEALSG